LFEFVNNRAMELTLMMRVVLTISMLQASAAQLTSKECRPSATRTICPTHADGSHLLTDGLKI